MSSSYESAERVVIAVAFLAASVLVACSPSEPERASAPAESAESAPAEAPAKPAAPAKPTKETACDDGADEDGDGKIDCKDSDCMPSAVCQIAHCQEVCDSIMACDTIVDSCSKKEHEAVLAGCKDGCASDSDRRGQVSAADGVPCFIIAGMFLDEVQKSGLCGGDPPSEAADGA